MSFVHKNVLVGIDGSDLSEKAFKGAMQLAKDYSLHLYIAWIIDEAEAANSAYAFSKVLSEEKQNVEQEMLKKIQDASEFGLSEISSIVEVGDPKKFLTKDIPELYDIDLIVIGATGMGKIQQASTGSTTSYVVDNVDCNVFVIRH